MRMLHPVPYLLLANACPTPEDVTLGATLRCPIVAHQLGALDRIEGAVLLEPRHQPDRPQAGGHVAERCVPPFAAAVRAACDCIGAGLRATHLAFLLARVANPRLGHLRIPAGKQAYTSSGLGSCSPNH